MLLILLKVILLLLFTSVPIEIEAIWNCPKAVKLESNELESDEPVSPNLIISPIVKGK